MQTFLPYPEFQRSADVLDPVRRWKQCVETMQILNTLSGKSRGWVNHPAVRMWRGHTNALKAYFNTMLLTVLREKTHKVQAYDVFDLTYVKLVYPKWVGDESFHAAHRSNLLRKFPVWYGQFGWTEPNNLSYIWPV